MNFKKFLSLICSFSILASSLFCCKADGDQIKVSVFGDVMVGKTSIVDRLAYNNFKESYTETIGINFTALYNCNMNFRIFDISGEERFRRIAPTVIRHSQVGLFVCNADCLVSINNFDYWANLYIAESKNNIIIALNKCDLKSSEEVEQIRATLIEKLRSKNVADPENRVIAISAKTGQNIELLMECLIQKGSEYIRVEAEYIERERLKNIKKKTVKIGLIGTVIFGGVYALYKKCMSKSTHKDESTASNNVDSDSNPLTA